MLLLYAPDGGGINLKNTGFSSSVWNSITSSTCHRRIACKVEIVTMSLATKKMRDRCVLFAGFGSGSVEYRWLVW